MGNNVASTGELTTPEDEAEIQDVSEDTVASEADQTPAPTRRWWSLRRPLTLGLITAAALVPLIGWQGYVSYQNQVTESRNEQLLQAARQGALNLTTIDWQQADTDVQRIIDDAVGEFYDDFAQRAQPFVDVVKQAQSVSVGTVTEAALESYTDSGGQALVTVSVKTSSTAGDEAVPRAWRMRIAVQESEDQMKVSHVEFVP